MKYGKLKGRWLDYWVEHVRRGAPAPDERIPRYHRGSELDGLMLRLVDIPSWAAAGADLRRSSDFTKLVQIEGGIGLTGRLRAYLSQNGFNQDRDVLYLADGHPLSFADGRRPERVDADGPFWDALARMKQLRWVRRCPKCQEPDVKYALHGPSTGCELSVRCNECGHEDFGMKSGMDLQRMIDDWHDGAERSPH